MKPMARLFALWLFLIGLVVQSMPMAADAMPAMHDGMATVEMADCEGCPEETMSGGDACHDTGACASAAAAPHMRLPDWSFVSSVREMRRVFGDASPTGGFPAPMLEPPRRLV